MLWQARPGLILSRAALYGSASVPVAVDQNTAFPNGALGANIDTTMTVSSGATLLLAVVIVRGIASSISTCTWDPAGANQTLSLIGTIANTDGGSGGASAQAMALYGLVSPTAGATKTLRIATTNTFATTIAGISFFNTKTSLLTDAVTNFSKTADTTHASASIVNSITAGTNNMGIVVEHCDNSSSSSSSISGSATSGYTSNGNTNMRCGYGVGAGSLTQTLTADVSGDNFGSLKAEIIAA